MPARCDLSRSSFTRSWSNCASGQSCSSRMVGLAPARAALRSEETTYELPQLIRNTSPLVQPSLCHIRGSSDRAACAMHGQGGFEGLIDVMALRPYFVPMFALRNPHDATVEPDIDTRAVRLVEDPFHKILVELRQRTFLFVEDGRLGPSTRGN